VGAGVLGVVFLTGVYIGIVSLAESPKHAMELFWEDRFIVIPIIVGFGVQAALYTILRLRLFIPVSNTRHSGAMMGASGTTSTLAMAACCAHHLADVLPLLGLTAAATFLAQYRLAFMLAGLGTTFIGIGIMLFILFRERRRAVNIMAMATFQQESL
jgi:hypothetical protein